LSLVRARQLVAVAVLFLPELVVVLTQVAWLAPWLGAPGVEREAFSHQQLAKEQPQPVALFAWQLQTQEQEVHRQRLVLARDQDHMVMRGLSNPVQGQRLGVGQASCA
jgi:hypothetical protein